MDKGVITLNTEYLAIEIRDNLFQTRLPVILRETAQQIGSVIIKLSISNKVEIYLLQDKWTHSQQEETILGLSQYLFAAIAVSTIQVHGLEGSSKYLDNSNNITVESIKQASKSLPITSCAIVILINQHNQVLLGKRPKGKFMPDVWEFPGGKLEAHENEEEAAKRELMEELGIEIQDYKPILHIQYAFKHFVLNAYISLVTKWNGEPKPLVHSSLKWTQKTELPQTSMPLSNLLFIDRIRSL